MKKLFVSILAIFYLASSTGATVHMHYCMGKMVAFALNGDGAESCNKCVQTEENESCSKDCCDEEQKTVKLENDQKTAENLVASFPALHVQSSSVYFNIDSKDLTSIFSGNNALSHAPPLIGKSSLTILHRSFRI